MELTVHDRVIAQPSAADIIAAVDAAPKSEDWYLTLDSGKGDSLDVTFEDNGEYRIVCAQKGDRYIAETADEGQLKAVLTSYFAGDEQWRSLCRWKIERKPKVTKPVQKTASSEPPVWAIVAVIAAVFFIGIYAELPANWRAVLPFGNSEFGFVFVIFLPMVVMIVAMLIHKLGGVRKAAAWPSAQGRITRSTMGSALRQFEGEEGRVINAPEIAYEFTTHGRKWTGTRIGIGEDSGGANSEVTLKRYPVGAAVTVYYNPKDPSDCVLERDAPEGFGKGCLALLGVATVIGVVIWWAIQHGQALITANLPHANAGAMLFAIGFGLVTLLMFIASLKVSKQAKGWASVEGKVLISTTQSFERYNEGRHTTMYAPLVEYSYQVNGQAYRSRQIKLGVKVETGQAGAEKTAARYPEGGVVQVRYDPANPGNAALEMPGGYSWIMLAIALFCFGVAAKASGAFG